MNGNNISISHSVNIVMSQLIISYCFWRSYLTGRVWLPFPYRDGEFDMETDVIAKTAVCGKISVYFHYIVKMINY